MKLCSASGICFYSKILNIVSEIVEMEEKMYIFGSSAGVVIIDDHPEVTVIEDFPSNLNDDGFTEVVSKKQQKRLQDEERRKKEEQTVQV